ILEAYRKRATDIHLEPHRGDVAIRYRIDGILYDITVSPEVKNYIIPIISRIKIMCNLNIVERRLPQDGRAIVKAQDQTLDLRISTLPTPHGESIVIRILPTTMLFSLEKLGLSRKDLDILEELLRKSYGIIFVTGPTGSGKTTTLYACLRTINIRERKIITLEDPIEYELKGIIQIQVHPQIGLDFARGLRSILRHDPDIIMVGEVRDLETAEIAIRVALTGHLIFSTLHTNDAASGITRLIDIGIEPYLIASSVEAFIAQRLVRVICPNCKYEDAPSRELKDSIRKELDLESADKARVFKGKGCEQCNFTGFFGRTALYEILLVDDDIKELILKRLPSSEIKKMAKSKGMHTLMQDGWRKVVEGITTPEEVLRVISAQEYMLETRTEGIPVLKEAISDADRRAYPRLDTSVNVHYKGVKGKGEFSSKGFGALQKFAITKNISASGVCFTAPESLVPDSVLDLQIDLPDGKGPIKCLGRVVWVNKLSDGNSEVGISLLDLTGGDKKRIGQYVKQELGE
ncbi:MAG: Flp pilus assembly complex ATPase component TadA, partial [Candidatus Omnitrophota bacterium]